METPREFLILSLRSWSPGRITCLSLICQSPTRHWKCIVPLQKRPRYWRMRLGGHFCPSDTSALTSSGQHHSYIVRQFKSKTRLWEIASVDAQGLVPHFTVFTCWPALGVTQNEIRKGIEWELGRGRHIYWLPLLYLYSSLVAFIPTGCWLRFVIQMTKVGATPGQYVSETLLIWSEGISGAFHKISFLCIYNPPFLRSYILSHSDSVFIISQ